MITGPYEEISCPLDRSILKLTTAKPIFPKTGRVQVTPYLLLFFSPENWDNGFYLLLDEMSTFAECFQRVSVLDPAGIKIRLQWRHIPFPTSKAWHLTADQKQSIGNLLFVIKDRGTPLGNDLFLFRMEMIQGNSLPLTYVRFCLLSPSQQHWLAAEENSFIKEKKWLFSARKNTRSVGWEAASSFLLLQQDSPICPPKTSD